MDEIKDCLVGDYFHFLKGHKLLAAFHKYVAADEIDYQIVMETTFGTFNAIVSYNSSATQKKVELKSLSIIDINQLPASYLGCENKD